MTIVFLQQAILLRKLTIVVFLFTGKENSLFYVKFYKENAKTSRMLLTIARESSNLLYVKSGT